MPPEQNAPAPDITGTDAANAAMPSGTPQGPPMAPPPGTPGVLPDAPNVSNLPAVSNPGAAQAAQNAMAAQQFQQQQAKAGLARDAAHGAAFNFLAGNTPQKPGQMFRNILAGAILGGAAGGQSHNFTGGFGLGAAAGYKNVLTQQDRLRAQQQQQFENQLKYSKELREQNADERDEQTQTDAHLWHQEQAAHEHVATTREQQLVDKAKQEEVDRVKASNIEAEKQWKGTPGSQLVTGLPTTIGDFVKTLPQNPNMMKASDPKNFQRHFIAIPQTGEEENVTFNGDHWEDADTHQPVSIAYGSKLIAYDVPTNGLDKAVMHKESDLAKAYPGMGFDPKSTKEIPLTGEALIGLKTKTASIAATNAETNERKAHAAEDYAAAAEHKAKAKLADDAAKVGINLSPNFVQDPDAYHKTEAELRATMQAQGQSIPWDFSTAYNVAHYRNGISDVVRTSPYNRPGTTQQKSADQLLTEVLTFINPTYSKARWEAVQQINKDLANLSNNKPGGNVLAFDTAVRHIDRLAEFARDLDTKNVQKYNEISQWLQVQTGRKVPAQYDAIKEVLVGELGKVFKNAAVDQNLQDKLDETLDRAQSENQLSGVVHVYLSAMKDKIDAIGDRWLATTGQTYEQDHDGHGLIDPQAKEILDRSLSPHRTTAVPRQTLQPNQKELLNNGRVVGYYSVDPSTQRPIPGSKVYYQ